MSINAIVGDNGVLNNAQKASKETTFASEKEAIEFVVSDVQIDLNTGKTVDQGKMIGEKLLTKNLENAASWKIVTETVDDKTTNKYGTNWYYLEKGTDVNGKKLTNSYIVNYLTGKIVNFEEGKHKFLSVEDFSEYYTPENLILNIDPRNDGRI